MELISKQLIIDELNRKLMRTRNKKTILEIRDIINSLTVVKLKEVIVKPYILRQEHEDPNGLEFEAFIKNFRPNGTIS